MSVDAMMDLSWLLRTFGPLLIAVVFFLYRDYKREDRLMTRIQQLEDEQRDVMMPMVEACTDVISRNTEVLHQNTLVMTRLETFFNR